jgi:hypothetical protein
MKASNSDSFRIRREDEEEFMDLERGSARKIRNQNE